MSEPDPRLASARLHADVERLRAQAVLSWPREARALSRVGLSDGMAVLEVGSGPGFITEFLLEALPRASITGVDLDPAMCAFAREHLAAYPRERWEVVESSILQTDLASDSFDFALVRFVLQHLSAPDFALMEILRLLRRGGIVAILDIDDALGGLVAPVEPAFALVAQKVRRIQAEQAGNREIGRHLWRLLSEAGYADVELEALVLHSDELGLEPFLPQYAPSRYLGFVRPGGLTMEDWHNYRQAFDHLVTSPEAQIVQLILLASGRKPLSRR